MAEIKDMDALARERISTDISKNFFVEAGAGSGKTTQLVARMTAMVRAGIDVRKICAITFTKTAAREFYKRFQKSLSEAIKNTTDDTERQRYTEALNNIDLCFMGTIDSFSHLILHEHPMEGRIPSNSSVKEEGKMTAVYMREYARIVNGEYGDELLEKYKLFSKFQGRPEKAFSSFIGNFIENRNAELIFPPSNGTDITAAVQGKREAFLQALECVRAHEEYWGTVKECIIPNETLRTKFSVLKADWNNDPAQIIDIISSLDKFRLSVDPAEIGIVAPDLFKKVKTRSAPGFAYELDTKNSELYRIITEMQYFITIDFLSFAARSIADTLRQNGELTYFDYKLYLRDMLKRDAENGGKLIRHIYDRHSYFLIDEFQDTDPMQAEIFFYLSAEKPVPDWRKCVPRAGSLFIVGDPKQSIYRFRSADVTSFLGVRQLFENGAGEVLHLTRNYRSTVHLKEWFNDKFSVLLPSESPQQSKFSRIPIEGSDTDGLLNGVWSYEVVIDRNSVVDSEQRTADVIERLVNNPAVKIQVKQNEEPRMLKYSDIMVILHAKDKIVNYLREFGKRSIPAMVEGKISFTSCPAYMAMVSIMEALAAPNDQAAVYGALTSNIFRISDGAITDLRNKGIWLELCNSDKLPEDCGERVSSAFAVLKRLSSKAGYFSPAAAFSVAMDELRVLEKAGTGNLEYLYYALELLRAAEVSGEVSDLRTASSFLRSLIDDNATERCISLTTNADRVHIANLHKVKGLEAPVVILAQPRKQDYPVHHRTENTSEGSKHWVFKLSSGYGNTTFNCAETSAFEAVSDIEQTYMDAENVRLLYVAATRARNALIIAEAVKADGSRANKNPWEPLLTGIDGEFFKCVPPKADTTTVSKTFFTANELYDKAANDDIFAEAVSKKNTYEIKLPSQIKLNTVTSESTESDDIPDKGNAALVGTMVHRLMEFVVSAKAIPDEGKLIKDILNSYGADEEYGKLLSKVYNSVTNGGFPQNNGMPRDILSELKSAEEFYCEVPFCHKVSEDDGSFNLWNGIIDLLYKKNGKWRIVDYKTNYESEQLDYKYAEQLNAYKTAFKDITGEDAEAIIYHIDV